MTTTVVTSAGDLHVALAAALRFADERDGWPQLNAVYIEADEDRLTVTATDRRVLGQASISAAGSLPGGALLACEHAKLLAGYLGGEKSADLVHLTPVTSHIKRPRLRIEHPEGNFALEVPNQVAEAPRPAWIDYRPILAKFEGLVGVDCVSSMLLQPEIIAPVASLRKVYDLPARWTFLGPLEPVRVEIGKAFTAVLMPAKPSRTTETHFGAPAGEQA